MSTSPAASPLGGPVASPFEGFVAGASAVPRAASPVPSAAGHRGRLVTSRLVEIVAAATRAGATVFVLDCGGGTGATAVPLAVAGAHATVVDRSVDALAILGRRAADAGVSERVVAVPGDLDADDLGLPAVAGVEQVFDLVVAHDVLTSVADADATLASVARRVAPGGHLSLQVVNLAALVLGRALAGDVASAAHALDAPRPGAYELRRVLGLVGALGLEPVQVLGIGVLSEYVSGPDLEAHGAEIGELLDLEVALAGRPPYRDIASRLHVLARRPDGDLTPAGPGR